MPGSDLIFLEGMSPADVGLPPKFPSWREGQAKAVDQSLASDKRFVVHSMPVGGGKSAIYMAEALYSASRVAILTSTKALQTQLMDDFASVGLKKVMGRQNFSCQSNEGRNCEDGSICGCMSITNGSCPYKLQYQDALASNLLTPNYAYWGAIHRYGEGLGDFDILIMDEAHEAADTICGLMDVYFTSREVEGMLRTSWPKMPAYVEGWREFAQTHLKYAEEKETQFREYARSSGISTTDMKLLKDWKELASKLKTAAEMVGEWIVQPVNTYNSRREKSELAGYKLRVVWPRTYAERVLFRSIRKVIMVSATVMPRNLSLLGLSPNDYDYFTYPYTFPLDRGPIYVIPVVKMNAKSNQDDYDNLFAAADEIIGDRLDRKGIVHATSYERARMFCQQSAYSSCFITHTREPGSLLDAMERFERAKPPAVFISPSVTTGEDFKYRKAEYQILLKAPYGDFRDPVSVRRAQRDDSYTHGEMATTLAQTCGRIVRAEDDRGESFILDATVKRILKWRPGLWPAYFHNLLKFRDTIPPPPPTLAEEFPGRWED